MRLARARSTAAVFRRRTPVSRRRRTVRFLRNALAREEHRLSVRDAGMHAREAFLLREPGEVAAVLLHPGAEALPHRARFGVRKRDAVDEHGEHRQRLASGHARSPSRVRGLWLVCAACSSSYGDATAASRDGGVTRDAARTNDDGGPSGDGGPSDDAPPPPNRRRHGVHAVRAAVRLLQRLRARGRADDAEAFRDAGRNGDARAGDRSHGRASRAFFGRDRRSVAFDGLDATSVRLEGHLRGNGERGDPSSSKMRPGLDAKDRSLARRTAIGGSHHRSTNATPDWVQLSRDDERLLYRVRRPHLEPDATAPTVSFGSRRSRRSRSWIVNLDECPATASGADRDRHRLRQGHRALATSAGLRLFGQVRWPDRRRCAPHASAPSPGDANLDPRSRSRPPAGSTSR